AGPRAVGRALHAGRPRVPAGKDGRDRVRRIPPGCERRHARGAGAEPADRTEADGAMSVARPAALLAELIACETAVWQALVSGDAEADRAALAADFLGVYPDGFAGRDAHAAQLSGGPTVTGF